MVENKIQIEKRNRVRYYAKEVGEICQNSLPPSGCPDSDQPSGPTRDVSGEGGAGGFVSGPVPLYVPLSVEPLVPTSVSYIQHQHPGRGLGDYKEKQGRRGLQS